MYQTGTVRNIFTCSRNRFFKQNDTAVLQLYYTSDGVLHSLDVDIRKVVPVSVEIGCFDTLTTSSNTWQSIPLIPLPGSIDEDLMHITGFTTATHAMAIHPLACYMVNGYRYRDGVKLKSYYSSFREETAGSISFTVLQKIEMERNYFKDIGLVEQMTHILTQRLGSDGSVTVTKEHFIHRRGPEGAPKYADWESW